MLALERNSPSAAHWPESTYVQVFAKNNPTRIALIAVCEDEEKHGISGFVIARVLAGDCELENIIVASEHRNHGIGSQLVEALVNAVRNRDATRIFLEVRESNAAARRLYEKCGFATTGHRPGYYASPTEDAILYSLSL